MRVEREKGKMTNTEHAAKTPNRLQVGTRATIIANTALHNLPLGTKVVVTNLIHNPARPGTPERWQIQMKYPNGNPITVYAWHADLKSDIATAEEMAKEILELEEQISALYDRLTWMRTVGREGEFDEQEYQIWKATEELFPGESDNLDKTEKIRKILRSALK